MLRRIKKEREYETRYRAIRISRTFSYASYMRNRKRPSINLSYEPGFHFHGWLPPGRHRDFIFRRRQWRLVYFANNYYVHYPLDVESLLSPESVGRSEELPR